MINNDLLIRVFDINYQTGQIKLGFEGPIEKYTITRMEVYDNREKEEE